MSERHRDFRPDDFLEHNEVARLFHVAPRTLTRYREAGKIPFVQMSPRTVIYPRVDVMAFIKRHYQTQVFETESNGQGLLFSLT